MQLAPFNDYRYDLVVAHVWKGLNAPFDIYDMVKTHALVDAFHVAETGKPVIGGIFKAWKHGPVATPAYARAKRILDGAEAVNAFEVINAQTRYPQAGVRRDFEPDPDEFSQSEVDAMRRTAEIFMRPHDELYEFFHDPNTFIGSAWKKAWDAGGAELSWREIVAAYEREFNTSQNVARYTLDAVGA